MWLDYTDRRVAKSGQSELWQGFLISHVPSFHGCYQNGIGPIHSHLTTAGWLDPVHFSFKFHTTLQRLRWSLLLKSPDDHNQKRGNILNFNEQTRYACNFYCCTVHFYNIKILFTNKCTPLLQSQTARHTIHTTAWNTCCHNTANHITMYFYWLIPQNCNFSKARYRLPEDGPGGPKHLGANMRYFNCTF